MAGSPRGELELTSVTAPCMLAMAPRESPLRKLEIGHEARDAVVGLRGLAELDERIAGERWAAFSAGP